MAPPLALNLSYELRHGKVIPVLKDDRGHELETVTAVKVESRVDTFDKVTVEFLIDHENVTLGHKLPLKESK